MEEMRLINILAELCQADPADIKWDGSGECDLIHFTTSGKDRKSFVLKLAKDNVGRIPSGIHDFRVRVLEVGW